MEFQRIELTQPQKRRQVVAEEQALVFVTRPAAVSCPEGSGVAAKLRLSL
ncbi:MAG: hypothetical protein ACT4QB_10020 [Gammaproteobacteria bacterium]